MIFQLHNCHALYSIQLRSNWIRIYPIVQDHQSERLHAMHCASPRHLSQALDFDLDVGDIISSPDVYSRIPTSSSLTIPLSKCRAHCPGITRSFRNSGAQNLGPEEPALRPLDDLLVD